MPPDQIRVAIDAGALVRDRRGMGNVARGVVAAMLADPSVAVTLVARRRERTALRDAFPGVASAGSRALRQPGRFDVVWFPFNGMRAVPAAPAAVTIHDAFAFTEPAGERIARAREQGPIRRAARHAAGIATQSHWSRAELARELRLDPAAIEVIAPEPAPFFGPGLIGKLPAPLQTRRYVLVVGVREARKNARLAIEAAARALGPGERLVVVGELGAADRAFAAARLPGRAGEIAASDAMLRALYRGAGAVLVPSLAEGFGLVVAEALACGAPVLAADTSALPETARGSALLLDPRDPDAWAQAIRTILDDPAVATASAELGEAAYPLDGRGRHARETLAFLRATAELGVHRRA